MDARRTFPLPDVFIGQYHFSELYDADRWQRLMEYFAQAVHEEIESQRTPRQYLADENRFLNFFVDHIRRQPGLGIGEDSVQDVLPHVFDEFFGLGLLRAYLDDPEVEDIICDSAAAMDVVKRGVKHRVRTPWVDDADLARWLQRMASGQGKSLSPHSPVENGQLADGSRIIMLIPPVVATPGFSLRKHRVERFQREAYVQSGVAPMEFFADLQQWVHTRQNIIFSGATGSGKTTMTNFAASLIPVEERVLVVEDTRELQIPHPRVYQMTATARGARIGRGQEEAITLRDLVAHTLRMKPDRIIVGEVRGPEAFDLLNAMNTGHDGGMSTLHSNSPSEAVLRLESLAAPAQPNMPLWALQDLIAVTVGVVIQLKQEHGSSRRVVVEASQVLHPTQALDASILTESSLTRQLRENLWLRRLWMWDNDARQLRKVNDFAPLDGQYFV